MMNYNEEMFELGNHGSAIRELFEYGRKRKKIVGEENVFDYLTEMTIYSLFDNKERIKEVLEEKKSFLESMFLQAGHMVALRRAFSYFDPSSYYIDSFSGVRSYDNLCKLLSNYDDNFDKLKNSLNDLSKEIFRKENLIISYTGNEYKYRDYLPYYFNNLYKVEIKKYNFIFHKDIKNEALKIPGQVQYVAKVGHFDKNKYTGAFLTLNQILSYEYLWVQVRVLGGAYGAMSQEMRDGKMYFVSYRDPKLKETLSVYDNIPAFIESMEYSDAELTKFIIGTIGQVDQPLTPRRKGEDSFEAYCAGISDEIRQQTKNEIINTTLKDLKALKPLFEEALNQNIYCVVGNENVLEENKDIFKNVINLIK